MLTLLVTLDMVMILLGYKCRPPSEYQFKEKRMLKVCDNTMIGKTGKS